MAQDISRRAFLKTGLTAAAGLAASGLALPQAVQASQGGELCTLLDLSKCIGCEACVEACREQWQAGLPDPAQPIPRSLPPRVPVEDWSTRKQVQDRLTPYNFLYLEHLEVPHQGRQVELHLPRRCMHCSNPPCSNLCPFGACQTEQNGAVHIEQDICLGGAKCKNVCPWHIPQRQSGVGLYLSLMPQYMGNGVMFKCHRCLPLLAQGQAPRCIEACPQQVQGIGPRQEQVAKAEALARDLAQKDGVSPEKWRDYVYGLDENGGTNTIYVAPLPFQEINAALLQDHQERAQKDRAAEHQAGRQPEAGNLGRPHMGPVKDSMADAKNLTLALAVAPLAGLAAGLGRFFSKTRKLAASAAPLAAPASSQKGGLS
ncbi:MAG: 4Fe-4S dicluster domain-containing protein [Desulfarculus sp.]|nr:4Fe-4S dicluster domain-containing protein [Desulfarculus sp.]